MAIKEDGFKLHYGHVLLWAAFFMVWLGVFNEALFSAAKIWMASKTYNHCFFVLPIALYLAFEKRHEILSKSIRPNYFLLIPICLSVCLWALGIAGDVALFTHAGAFSILPLSVWLLCGNQIARQLWFPLLYLLFLIPVGEELVPWLQQITADISVFLLQLSSVPVFRDGLYISIPEGRFEVAEACSGIRFFISTLMLASVFAYVSYRSFFRRAAFLLVAVILPVIANGVRAFGTIMVGRYFGVEHAAGADHLVYGWVFFAIVIAGLFTIGNSWRQTADAQEGYDKEQISVALSWLTPPTPGAVVVAVVPFVVALILQMSMQSGTLAPHRLNVNALPAANLISLPLIDWQPQFPHASDVYQGKLAGTATEAYIGWYAHSSSGSELIAWENKIYRTAKWSLVSKNTHRLEVLDGSMVYGELDLRSLDGRKRLVAYYYSVPGMLSSNDKIVKLKQAWHRMTGRTTAGAIVAFSQVYSNSKENVQRKLQRQIKDSVPAVMDVLPFPE